MTYSSRNFMAEILVSSGATLAYLVTEQEEKIIAKKTQMTR